MSTASLHENVADIVEKYLQELEQLKGSVLDEFILQEKESDRLLIVVDGVETNHIQFDSSGN